jgi:hypothetical protein
MAIYQHNEIIHNSSAAEKILPIIIKEYQIKSILDIGTGIGTWLSVAEKYGISDYIGIDGEWVDRKLLKIPESKFIAHDLTKPINLNKQFDLIICLEVAEHLPDEASYVLIETIINHGSLILFSSAIPFQGGQNHINEQPYSYWEERFKLFDYKYFDYLRALFWQDKHIEWWYRQNIFIISKNFIPPLASNNIQQQNMNMYIHPELFYSQVSLGNKRLNDLNLLKDEFSKMYSGEGSILFYCKLLLKSLIRKIQRWNILKLK